MVSFAGMHSMESRPAISRTIICFVLLLIIIRLTIPYLRKYPITLVENIGVHSEQRVIYNRLRHKRDTRKDFESHPNFTHPLHQLEPKTDNRTNYTKDDIIQNVENILPNLPISYWNRYSDEKIYYKNETCAKLPSIFDLEFNNLYWQTLYTSNGTFQLYGAYYDVRKLNQLGPAVRLLGMIDRLEPTVKTYCQFWFDDLHEPVIVKSYEYKYIWYRKWGNYRHGIYQPYLIACQIPRKFNNVVPVSVSLVESVCDVASNNLRIIYNKPPSHEVKRNFAVCVKGLDFLYRDISVRLVEWIELLHLVGADKVFFYRLHVHENVSKVLDHYERLGMVDVTPLTLPGGQPNAPGLQHLYLSRKINHKRQNELIPYNDCLYRNMYRYEYVVLLDVDEIILPVKVANWSELMDTVLTKAFEDKNETRASYNVRNVYFLDEFIYTHGYFDGIPSYMHMLQHVYRSKNFTKPNQYVKCFHNPERVLMLHNHFPLACLSQGCTSYAIDTEDAQLQHYRTDCVKTLRKSCSDFKKNNTLDTTIWRYKDALINRTTTTLDSLGYFGNHSQDLRHKNLKDGHS